MSEGSAAQSTAEAFYAHGLKPMTGRAADAARGSSSLEALFDLVFASAFGVLAAQLAGGITAGYGWVAVGAFAFGVTATSLAWINYAWFASAFDTDDWLYRLLTLVQMAGAIVFAISLPAVFAEIEAGRSFADPVMVGGYVIMRIALVLQWLRAAHASRYRSTVLTYAITVSLGQLGWVVLAIIRPDFLTTLALVAVFWALEFGGPVVAELTGRARGIETPWNAQHVADRFSLVVIIALGETVAGTIASGQQVSAHEGWTRDAAIVIAIGIAMTFALWWTYSLLPSAPVLARHRRRAFVWGYTHVLVFLSIAGVGAGLHLIGARASGAGEGHVTDASVVLFIGLPVLTFLLAMFALQWWLARPGGIDPRYALPALVLPSAGIVAGLLGVALWPSLALVLAGPVWLVVAYEAGMWRMLRARLVTVLTAPAG